MQDHNIIITGSGYHDTDSQEKFTCASRIMMMMVTWHIDHDLQCGSCWGYICSLDNMYKLGTLPYTANELRWNTNIARQARAMSRGCNRIMTIYGHYKLKPVCG